MSENNTNLTSVKTEKKESAVMMYVRLAGVLTAICICVAALLAVVNMLTRDVIAANAAKEREETVFAIFEGADKMEEYALADGKTVYLVYSGDAIVGYSVNIAAGGFGGNIDMMVGINSDGTVKGTKIISMSETPGVGTKVNSDSFLGQFTGKGDDIALGETIDAISGATISSRAVTDGVKSALAYEVDLEKIAEEKGATVVPDEN